jgi:predicted DNA-binding transcriptional regulator AlpA
LIPVSKSTIYRLVAAGRFPAPIKPSSSISLWSNDAVKVALESWGQNDE